MVERASAQRKRMVLAVAAALLVVAGLVWAVIAAGSGAPATPTQSASTGPSQSASSAPVARPTVPAPTPPAASAVPTASAPPTGGTGSGSPIAPEADPVAPDEVAAQAGVEVELARVEHVDGEAIAPGEIAGPAIRLTIEVRNGSNRSIDAGLIAVNAYFGEARTPGNSLMQPGGSPFGGAIPAGQSARGVYLFEAGSVDLADVLVGVDVLPGSPTFTFRGDLR